MGNLSEHTKRLIFSWFWVSTLEANSNLMCIIAQWSLAAFIAAPYWRLLLMDLLIFFSLAFFLLFSRHLFSGARNFCGSAKIWWIPHMKASIRISSLWRRSCLLSFSSCRHFISFLIFLLEFFKFSLKFLKTATARSWNCQVFPVLLFLYHLLSSSNYSVITSCFFKTAWTQPLVCLRKFFPNTGFSNIRFS